MPRLRQRPDVADVVGAGHFADHLSSLHNSLSGLVKRTGLYPSVHARSNSVRLTRPLSQGWLHSADEADRRSQRWSEMVHRRGIPSSRALARHPKLNNEAAPLQSHDRWSARHDTSYDGPLDLGR
jgi:hypothetical protein